MNMFLPDSPQEINENLLNASLSQEIEVSKATVLPESPADAELFDDDADIGFC